MQLLVTSYAQSTFKLQHSPSALPSHFQLRINCAWCHYEFSYLHLDSVWLLFAVEIKGVWFSKVCMQSRQLFSLMLYSWCIHVSSFSIYVEVGGDQTKMFLLQGHLSAQAHCKKNILTVFKIVMTLCKTCIFSKVSKEIQFLLVSHVQLTSHISAALKADVFLEIIAIVWPPLVHLIYSAGDLE